MAKEKEENKFVPPTRTYFVELMVGVFSIVGILCFGYLSVNIAGMRFNQSDYYHLQAEFDNISGLEVGAPVEIAGVPVGEVIKVELNGTLALVTLNIKKGVEIRSDDIAVVRTKGIIGERYMKIVTGASTDFVKAGSRITDTESVVDFEEIIGKLIHQLQ